MTTEISKVYDKTRDELIQYEDSEFVLLTSHVPNFYISRNDQTNWGGFLRTIAAELGRMEYFHSYDLVSKDPSYMNPADIRRMWNDPLFISRNYPTTTQYDLDYKNLVLKLIAAYSEGATAKAIADVITAYMGSNANIHVNELFEYASMAPYDISYRNTITAFVPILTLGDPDTQVLANNLYTLSHDLYKAVDLAKPAHVGLELGLVLGCSEDKFRPIIDEVSYIGTTFPTSPVEGEYDLINDTLYQYVGGFWTPIIEPGTNIIPFTPIPRICSGLRFIIACVESPLPDPLYEAPFEDPTHPDTGLASNSSVYTKPAYGTSASNPINIFGKGFLTGSVAVNFTGVSGWVPAASVQASSDTQLIVGIPTTALSGPIQVVITSGMNVTTLLTAVDFLVQTDPVTYSRPGVLTPLLNRAWEIKSDNVDILNLD